jgi:hypothetical protein
MGRKTKLVQIADGSPDEKSPAYNRDHGKTYLLTEMSATQGQRWAMRGLLALGRGNVEVPPDLANAGMAGWAIMGLQMISKLSFAEADSLLEELMGCVQVMPDPANPMVVRRLVESDVEEITTRVRLQKEVFALHGNFSVAESLSMLTSGISAQAS